MWERVDEMNMMIDTSRTPSVARKDVSNKKQTKNTLYGWIYRPIATIHHKSCWCETQWKMRLQDIYNFTKLGWGIMGSSSIRLDLGTSNMELSIYWVVWYTIQTDLIIRFFVCLARPNNIHWQVDEYPNMSYIIASRYNVILVSLSMLQNWIFMIIWMFLKDGCPLSPIAPQWSTYYTRETRSWQRSTIPVTQKNSTHWCSIQL